MFCALGNPSYSELPLKSKNKFRKKGWIRKTRLEHFANSPKPSANTMPIAGAETSQIQDLTNSTPSPEPPAQRIPAQPVQNHLNHLNGRPFSEKCRSNKTQTQSKHRRIGCSVSRGPLRFHATHQNRQKHKPVRMGTLPRRPFSVKVPIDENADPGKP